MLYVIQDNQLTGNDAFQAAAWVEERREQLLLREAERQATVPGQDRLVINMLKEVLLLLKHANLLPKIVVGCLVLAEVGSVVLFLKKLALYEVLELNVVV